MTTIGIRALQQNASAVIAEVASGATVTITDRGRPVARMTPIAESPLHELLAAGVARPPRRPLASLGPPPSGPSLSAEVERMRADERD